MRQFNAIGLLKQGEDPELLRSNRGILLLCHIFKPYEKPLLKWIKNSVIQNKLNLDEDSVRAKSTHLRNTLRATPKTDLYERNSGRPDCNLSRILMLLNTYTNYQPTTPYSKYFLYTDDLAISLQDKNFEEVKLKFERILSTFSAWYEYNSLKSKPAKLQVCTFLLCTNEAKRTWRENHNILELL